VAALGALSDDVAGAMAGLDAGADPPAESAEELVVTVDEPVSVLLPASGAAG